MSKVKSSKTSVQNVKTRVHEVSVDTDLLEDYPEEKYEQYADDWEDEPSYVNMKRRKLTW